MSEIDPLAITHQKLKVLSRLLFWYFILNITQKNAHRATQFCRRVECVVLFKG